MSPPWPRGARLAAGRVTHLGGVATEELAATCGTPLYVLDRAELVGRMREYRAAVGPEVAVVYAAKALCVTAVLQLAAAEGLGVDVASGGELATAVRAGAPPARLVFHGSNKSVAELAAAADLGVGRIVVDSGTELERLSALGRERGQDLPILLRVTPGVGARTHDFIETGREGVKFGFALSGGLARRAVERALALPGVALRGVHCHVGSQVTSMEPYAEAIDRMVGLLGEVRDAHGVELAELNVGGGLGIAHRPGDQELDVADYGAAVLAQVRAQAAARDLAVPRLTVEPGRWIVGTAGVTLYTVGTVKEMPGRTFLSVDGGMSDNLRPALYGAAYTFAAAGSGTHRDGGTRRVSVAGKHCESGDVLGHDVELPDDLGEGDLLAVAATGAYTHAMASNYNRLPRPAMVLVGDGQATQIVRRESLDDVLSRDVTLRL